VVFFFFGGVINCKHILRLQKKKKNIIEKKKSLPPHFSHLTFLSFLILALISPNRPDTKTKTKTKMKMKTQTTTMEKGPTELVTERIEPPRSKEEEEEEQVGKKDEKEERGKRNGRKRRQRRKRGKKGSDGSDDGRHVHPASPPPLSLPSASISLEESSSSGVRSLSGGDLSPSGVDTSPSGVDLSPSIVDTSPSGVDTVPSVVDTCLAFFEVNKYFLTESGKGNGSDSGEADGAEGGAEGGAGEMKRGEEKENGKRFEKSGGESDPRKILSFQTNHGENLLHIAVKKLHPERDLSTFERIVHAILLLSREEQKRNRQFQLDAFVNQKDTNCENTPLHLAAFKNKLPFSEILLQKLGADPLIENKYGENFEQLRKVARSSQKVIFFNVEGLHLPGSLDAQESVVHPLSPAFEQIQIRKEQNIVEVCTAIADCRKPGEVVVEAEIHVIRKFKDEDMEKPGFFSKFTFRQFQQNGLHKAMKMTAEDWEEMRKPLTKRWAVYKKNKSNKRDSDPMFVFSAREMEWIIRRFFEEHQVPKGLLRMAGFSPHQDRFAIGQSLRGLLPYFSYKNLDLSSIILLGQLDPDSEFGSLVRSAVEKTNSECRQVEKKYHRAHENVAAAILLTRNLKNRLRTDWQ